MTARACTCAKCVRACYRRPGWLAPGDLERIAAFLNMTEEQVFQTYLCVDFWVEDGELPHTELLVPCVREEDGGTRPGGTQRGFFPDMGRCVFLDEHDRCKVHPVKPHECREVMACEEDGRNVHLETARLWVPHQAVIRKLLGES